MSDPVTTAVESVSWWTQIWDARDQILGGVLADRIHRSSVNVSLK